MNTKTQPQNYHMPLVDQPITKKFMIFGADSEIEVTVEACPKQAVKYSFIWRKLPASGKRALCRGQVELLRKQTKQAADKLSTVSAESSGTAYVDVQHIKRFRLHQVDDFRFFGQIFEAS